MSRGDNRSARRRAGYVDRAHRPARVPRRERHWSDDIRDGSGVDERDATHHEKSPEENPDA